MGGVAALARQAGFRVSGSDAGAYPPMSEQLANLGIEVMAGYDPAHLQPEPDCVVIGNVMSRGNPAVEHVLNTGLPFLSGPEWLARHVLPGKWVLAVAGTHGKTSTSSMLVWILEYAGLNPGFLVGGVPANFSCSARLTDSDFFVLEADEYDTAFFDKRAKFVHYRPRTLVLNNLEFDHADIFADLDAIKAQFHQLLRTVPGQGLVLHAASDANLDAVLAMGCWTPTEKFAGDANPAAAWTAGNIMNGGKAFDIVYSGEVVGRVDWQLRGRHNVHNAVAAVAAALHGGIPPAVATNALGEFAGVSRRLELIADTGGVRVYDDFAHHPTAIASTLRGLREAADGRRIFTVLEPRSNTMKMGIHKDKLGPALASADGVYLYTPKDLAWDAGKALAELGGKLTISSDTEEIVRQLCRVLRAGDDVVFMSNGGFEGIQARLVQALAPDAVDAD